MSKISDLEYAIDSIETGINAIKEYKEFEEYVKDLSVEKSALESYLDELKEEHEEIIEEERKMAEKEDREQERQYWREVV